MSEREQMGVVIGKFLPYHRGHYRLLSQASSGCETLWVVVTHNSTHHIPPPVRCEWIRRDFPEAELAVIDQDAEGLADSDPLGWAEATLRVIGARPEIAFSSEPDYQRWAELMGARHELVDPAREIESISATEIRRDGAERHKDRLAPRVFEWLRERGL